MAQNRNNLVWIDLEMTGLNPEVDRIIEIATVITDSDLNVVAQGPVFAVHQSDELLAGMDAWNTKTHNGSGLVKRVQESQITEAEAEKQTLAFIREHVGKNHSPLCGNSIWQDRRFLAKYMPEMEAYFHYRLVDVSTLKELSKRWNPRVYKDLDKDAKHEALADILESIDELKHYRDTFLKLPESD